MNPKCQIVMKPGNQIFELQNKQKLRAWLWHLLVYSGVHELFYLTYDYSLIYHTIRSLTYFILWSFISWFLLMVTLHFGDICLYTRRMSSAACCLRLVFIFSCVFRFLYGSVVMMLLMIAKSFSAQVAQWQR